MKVKMEYHIISGSVIETRRCWMEQGRKKQVRGQRKAGASSLSKIKANEKEQVRRLARILNANFGGGLLFVTLKYSNERLPADYKAAKENMAKFLRAARKRCGKFKYVGVTANWSPKRNRPARLHHHIVMDIADMDILAELWPEGEFHVKVIRSPRDLSDMAAYLCANVHNEPGEKTWSACKGLEKPVYTEPKEIEFVDGIQQLPNTAVLAAEQTTSEDGDITGSYMRVWTFVPVKVRGGQIVLPRRSKKQMMPLTIDEAVYQNDE